MPWLHGHGGPCPFSVSQNEFKKLKQMVRWSEEIRGMADPSRDNNWSCITSYSVPFFYCFFSSDILHFNFPWTSYLPGVSKAKGKLFSPRRLRKWLLTKFGPELKRGDGAIHYSVTERKSRDVVEGSDRGAIQSGEPCLLPDAYCLEYSRTLFFGTAISSKTTVTSH